jgi:sugar lactone lactonase YvrE
LDPKVTILSDIACELGEGPSYDPATDTLWWFDILGCKLLEHSFPDGRTRAHDLPVMASAIAFTKEGAQVLATERGVERRNAATGRLELLAPIEADDAATRSNDSRVHQSGAFWIGTMGKKAEKRAGSIYHYAVGKVTRLFPEITIPNSICFSPAGDIAYFADTDRNMLYRVATDPATGLPAGEPALFLDQRRQPGGIDGSVCDAEGVIWNARWGSGRLDAYDPDGRLLRSIAVPARQSSCPAFVGRDAGRIAVTSALEGMDAAARAADPHGGKTFLVETSVRGRLEPQLRL